MPSQNRIGPRTCHQTTIADGQKAVLRFDLQTSTDAGQLLLHEKNFEVVEMHSADLHDPSVRAPLAPVLAPAANIPTLRIGLNGQVDGFEGLDATIDQTLNVLKIIEGLEADSEVFATTARMLRSPAGRAKMKAGASGSGYERNQA